jgi:tetrahydromethanopterin S-methyltransferase subunit E
MLNDEAGIKFTVGGFATWFVSLVNNVDVTQMLGFVGLVIGLVIQIASFIRNKKADERARQHHELQMQILQRQLSEGNK